MDMIEGQKQFRYLTHQFKIFIINEQQSSSIFDITEKNSYRKIISAKPSRLDETLIYRKFRISPSTINTLLVNELRGISLYVTLAFNVGALSVCHSYGYPISLDHARLCMQSAWWHVFLYQRALNNRTSLRSAPPEISTAREKALWSVCFPRFLSRAFFTKRI